VSGSPHSYWTDHGVFGTPGDVSPWDIRFDPNDVAHVERSTSGIRIRLWAEPALDEATLVSRVDGAVELWPMDRVGSGGGADLWEVLVALEAFEYSFAFRSEHGRPVYLAPSGVSNAIERIDRWEFGPDDGTGPDVPAWVRGVVIYQIFPDRFANGDPATDPPGVREWGTEPTSTSFFGGDLIGVTDRLEYLDRLGVDAIYLNPIFASPSNHRYDTVDYFSVDPVLGGNDALRDLVRAAHRRDIRIVLDASFNHVHPRFFAFADLIEHGSASEYAEWFRAEAGPVHIKYRPHLVEGTGMEPWFQRWRSEIDIELVEVDGAGPPFEPSYQSWYGVPTMPRVDLSHPPARSYMLDVAVHWIEEYEVDGWRMDVTRYVDPDFWDDLRARVRSVRSDAYLLAEVFGDTSQWLQGSRFDGTMNYTFRDLVVHFAALGDIDGARFLQGLNRLWGMYGESVSLVNHNVLSTHDVSRFLTVAGGEVDRLLVATACQMLFPGAPGVYYGDEAGVAGGEDPACRATFPWGGDPDRHPVHRLIAELAEFRRNEPALRLGRFRPVAASRDAVVFERRHGPERLLVGINRGAEPARFEIEAGEPIWGDTGGDGFVISPASAVVTRL
jgi:glycosidase